MEIRVLSGDEKQTTRALYEQCFPEDSVPFVDYYYREKCKDNIIMGGYEQGALRAMLHLNPYRLRMCGDSLNVHFIVAVATAPEARGQGKMGALMKRGMEYLFKRGEAFSFLLPANPAYYTSLGFRFWKNQRVLIWDMASGSGGSLSPLTAGEAQKAAQYANAFLENRFDLYVERDAAYYNRLILQQNSENGEVMARKNQTPDDISGLFCYSKEESLRIREPMFAEGCGEIKKPCLMGRLLCLPEFVSRLKSDEPVEEEFFLRDPVIWENNGRFHLSVDGRGGVLTRLEPKADEGRLPAYDISELGRNLFGRLRIFINEEV